MWKSARAELHQPHHSALSSGLHHDGARHRHLTRALTSSCEKRNIILTAMHIVIADQLARLRHRDSSQRPGWTVDARTQRPAAELARDLAKADALIVRSATTVDATVIADAPVFG